MYYYHHFTSEKLKFRGIQLVVQPEFKVGLCLFPCAKQFSDLWFFTLICKSVKRTKVKNQ